MQILAVAALALLRKLHRSCRTELTANTAIPPRIPSFQVLTPLITLTQLQLKTTAFATATTAAQQFLQQHYTPPDLTNNNGIALVGTESATKWRIATAIAGELQYTLLDARTRSIDAALVMATQQLLPCALLIDCHQTQDSLLTTMQQEPRLLVLLDTPTTKALPFRTRSMFWGKVQCNLDGPSVHVIVDGVAIRKSSSKPR